MAQNKRTARGQKQNGRNKNVTRNAKANTLGS